MTIQINAAQRLVASEPKFDKGESIESLSRANGMRVLFKDGVPRVFANRAQAEKAAARTGGEAYQDIRSARFMVRYK